MMCKGLCRGGVREACQIPQHVLGVLGPGIGQRWAAGSETVQQEISRVSRAAISFRAMAPIRKFSWPTGVLLVGIPSLATSTRTRTIAHMDS